MEELDNSNVSAAGALMLVYPNLSFTAALMSVIDRLENTTNVLFFLGVQWLSFTHADVRCQQVEGLMRVSVTHHS